ncbi:MAG TPA: hypothetical protein VJ844_11830 [Mucilaginibacter sp.]|nr:hypothetical protein [Mucilaginibacter sp.]
MALTTGFTIGLESEKMTLANCKKFRQDEIFAGETRITALGILLE